MDKGILVVHDIQWEMSTPEKILKTSLNSKSEKITTSQHRFNIKQVNNQVN